MSTPTAVRRRLRHHARSAARWNVRPKLDVSVRRLSVENLALLAWLGQTESTDPILLDIERIVRSGGTPSPLQWRVLRRAHADAEALRHMGRYTNDRIRRAASLARQRAAVASRAADHGGKGEGRTKEQQL